MTRLQTMTTSYLTNLLPKIIDDKAYAEEIIKELKTRVGVGDNFLSFEDQVDIIFNDFNFEATHEVFDKMGWGWMSLIRGEIYVPTVEMLREKSFRLLKDAWNMEEKPGIPTVIVGTGRLVASRSIWYGVKILNLSFEPICSHLDYDEVLLGKDLCEDE